MRVLEMECEGCGRLVRTAKDGDACGACDLALCHACLGGTARCPSCQRRFADCRELAPVVVETPSEPRHLRIALLAILAITLGFAYVSFSGSGCSLLR